MSVNVCPIIPYIHMGQTLVYLNPYSPPLQLHQEGRLRRLERAEVVGPLGGVLKSQVHWEGVCVCWMIVRVCLVQWSGMLSMVSQCKGGGR